MKDVSLPRMKKVPYWSPEVSSGEIFGSFTPFLMGKIYIPGKFLSCINEYTEPMVIFAA